MSNVERLLSAYARVALVRASLGWVAAAALLLSCSSTHLERGTETGNPPVLDVDKVALVVGSDSVRIVGRAGAVSPGGVSVEATIVGTGEIVRGRANADGSFEITLEASADAVVEVRARSGDESSRLAYVTRGGALVGTGDDDSLSCMQRTNVASQAAGGLASAADKRCQSAADCALVSTRTQCSDSCGELPIAAGAVAGLRAGIDRIDRELCASFSSDGCNVIALPCVPPPQGPVACVAGQCTQLQASASPCPSCLNQTVIWGPTNRSSTNTISGCDSFLRTAAGSPGCTGKVAHCEAGGLTTVERLIDALAHPEVEAALASGAVLGGPPTPGGLALNVQVGERSFVISNCGTGASCAPIPEGVAELPELLDRIANETCSPAACPPNAIFLTDHCASCGATGGCSSSSARCAVVCSDASPCASGLSCSARGVCEAVCEVRTAE
jgi:hypothetical protein